MSESASEPFIERVNRGKARWLKRVMYESSATAMQKCFAYAVTDYLNCVTLDCWPSFQTLAARFRCIPRTMERAARGLEAQGLLVITRVGRGYRFAPVFLPADDIRVPEGGHFSSNSTDTNVHESLLSNLSKSASRGPAEGSKGPGGSQPSFRRGQRGSIEIKVAEWLEPNGIEVLGRLAQIDDKIVDRLCRAYIAAALTDRELAAARLAAAQVKS